MMYLDLAELDQVFSLSPLWSTKAWRPARFKRSDYLGNPQIPLDEAVRERIFKETGVRQRGPIRLLANLRYFGYIINPIACYYCFDESENLQFIVVEVSNTPWGERTSYVLSCDPDKRFQRIQFDKKMHVSPFNPMNMKYHWTSNMPGKGLAYSLDSWCEDERRMDASLALLREEITSSSLALLLIRQPFMTAKVGLSIYWQALKLWIKRAPIYDHPKNKNDTLTTNPSEVKKG